MDRILRDSAFCLGMCGSCESLWCFVTKLAGSGFAEFWLIRPICQTRGTSAQRESVRKGNAGCGKTCFEIRLTCIIKANIRPLHFRKLRHKHLEQAPPVKSAAASHMGIVASALDCMKLKALLATCHRRSAKIHTRSLHDPLKMGH